MLSKIFFWLLVTFSLFLTGKIVPQGSENYFYTLAYISLIFLFRGYVFYLSTKLHPEALLIWITKIYMKPFLNVYFSFSLFGLIFLIPLIIIANDTIIKHLSISIFIALIFGVIKEISALFVKFYGHSK